MILDIIDDVAEAFWKIIISLVGGIFKLVNSAYRIFLVLAKAQIFNNDDFNIITKNMYEILSIVMLFALAYGILVKIVDPENSKSGVDGKKILQKLVMAIVLLALIPSIFSFMFGLQNAILESNVLNSLFTGTSDTGAETIENAGISMAVNSFIPFFTPNVDNSADPEAARSEVTNKSEYAITMDGESYGCKEGECTLKQVDEFALQSGNFGFYQAFALNIHEGDIDFQWLIALIVGGFLVYAIVSFCFDMALRICKLAFFEIIAPIAIFCNVIPKMEDVFKKWLSNTTKTFIAVFTRIIVMNFGVFLISIICSDRIDLGLENTGSWFLNLIAKCLLILGIVMFMRQAPKLLSDLFGFGDGDMKLGIKDKLKSSGAFAMGAAIGAGTTGLVRNTVHGVQNVRNAKGFKDKSKAILKLGGSAAAGAASGLTKGLWYAKDAGSGKDMKNAATQAANKTVENRMKRDNYTAAHSRGKGWLDDRVQNIIGHAEDTGVKVAGWAGYKNLAQLKLENAAMDEITSARDTFDSDVDSYIEKELAKVSFYDDGSIKEGSIVGIENEKKEVVTRLHNAQEKLNKARVSGVGVAEAQKEYLDILKEARYGVQDRVLCSTNNWNSRDDKEKAKLGSLRVDAVKYKGSIANNADLDPLKQAGIIGANFSQDVDLTLSRKAYDDNGNFVGYKDIKMIDDMNNNIKISKNNNKVEIATREQKKQEDNKK